ncbi:FAD-dependent monooxygenase [Gammaproteobacteria bacterium]|nr:FAD-dependent monooxygenase [Gammaproteobacteria bacterium]
MSQSVLISGGGIVGSFLGLELAAREIPFKIIEKNPFASSQNDHIRSLTLNLSASERLEDLGVTTESSLIKRMKIFDGSGSGKLSFNCDEANIDYLAKVLSFNDLREALIKKVESSISIGDEITSFKATESGIKASLINGSTLETNLLVIAEGRNSNLAKSIASENFSKDYEQVAKTFLVEAQELISDEAVQVFHEKEIFALMPYKNGTGINQFSVVWSMPKELARDLSLDNLSTHIQKFEKKLSCKIKAISELLSFPLSAHHLDEYCDQGVCIIADAAHSIHPLAGQGINLGISDAIILAEEIERAINADKDIGQLAFLKKYELRRKTLNASMIKGVDFLFNLFQQDNPYLRLGRNSGLKALDKLSFLKKNFILHASGIQKI